MALEDMATVIENCKAFCEKDSKQTACWTDQPAVFLILAGKYQQKEKLQKYFF